MSRLERVVHRPVVRWLALLALCSAYIQGAVTKVFDFPSAIGEMRHFGMAPPTLFAVGVIVFELVCSAAILSGRLRWLGALALAVFTIAATFVANAWWSLPPGPEQSMSMNGFFEHIGLAGAFVLVAWMDLGRKTRDG